MISACVSGGGGRAVSGMEEGRRREANKEEGGRVKSSKFEEEKGLKSAADRRSKKTRSSGFLTAPP